MPTNCTYAYVLVGDYPVTSSSTCVEADVPEGYVVLEHVLDVMGLFLLALIAAAMLWQKPSVRS